MSRATLASCAMQAATNRPRNLNKRTLLVAAAVLTAIVPAIAQMGGGSGGELQQKIAVIKQSVAENQQRLHRYQWVETTQLTLNGDVKPPKQSMCQYGPDGTVQKTAMGPPPEPPSGRRVKQRIIAKKTEEMQDYMGQVKSLLGMYVPPNPQQMGQSFQSGNASLNTTPGSQVAEIVFKNYAQPHDQMTLSFDTAARKVSSVDVNTYMGDSKDTVTLTVQMASLPDGTNYVQQSVLGATAKKLQVTTTNSNYQPIGAQ
jgi:hypothetical protein